MLLTQQLCATSLGLCSLSRLESCLQTNIALYSRKSQTCSQGVLPSKTALANTEKHQNLGFLFFCCLLLVAVNGSPATITIETCEDASDWNSSIGGTAWDPTQARVEGMQGKRETAGLRSSTFLAKAALL